MISVKKVIFVIVAIAMVLSFLFLKKEEAPKPISPEEFKEATIDIMRRRVELTESPDILIDNLPASAWVLAQKNDKYALVADYLLDYDIVLEVATAREKQEGTIKVTVGNTGYELPSPDTLLSYVFYSFYSLCPYRVVLQYVPGENTDIAHWVKTFRNVGSVVGGTADGSRLYIQNGNVKAIIYIQNDKTVFVEVHIWSENKRKIDAVKSDLLRNLKGLAGNAVSRGDWVFRSPWAVPGEWINSQIPLGSAVKYITNDYSYTAPSMPLHGEFVMWNGYLVEINLFFTKPEWIKASPVILEWFGLHSEAQETVTEDSFRIKVSYDDDIVAFSVRDDRLTEVFAYMQELNKSNNYGMIRQAVVENIKGDEDGKGQ